MTTTRELKGEARFELKRQLADTLQGRIYSAIDRNVGNHVVVKETWKQLVAMGKSRDGHTVPENFVEEKRILTYLSAQKDAHLGFVRLLDEWEDKDCFLYAMEMCRGGELFEYIKGMHSDGAVAHYTRQQSRLKQEEMEEGNDWIKAVQHMFAQIVSCMAWIHSKGVCHLDLSLENAMIFSRSKKQGNTIKIIDFGLAKYYPNGKFTNNCRVGKISYMAPEVFARKKYDPRCADIWSLGVMLFMMLIGAPPYQVPSPSNPAFNFIVNGRLRDVLKHWKRLRCVTRDAIDLLNKIFKKENERITMDDLLKHPFLFEATNTNKSEAEAEAQPQLKTQPPQTQTQTDMNGYAFTSQIAITFKTQLSSTNLPRDELTEIMRQIEQKSNSIQRNPSESKSQQTMREELTIIHKNVEQRLEGLNINHDQQQSKHKVERYKSETPHSH
eukprot:25952_1